MVSFSRRFTYLEYTLVDPQKVLLKFFYPIKVHYKFILSKIPKSLIANPLPCYPLFPLYLCTRLVRGPFNNSFSYSFLHFSHENPTLLYIWKRTPL